MKKQKKAVIMAVMTVLVCALASGICYFQKQQSEKTSVTDGQTRTEQQSETTDELERLLWNKIKLNGKKYKYSTDYETYLFMGTDGSGKEEAGRKEYIGNMADFLMLVIINRKEQTYAFLQLNRDTMTEINLIGRNGKGMACADMQLCTAHWYGGTQEESCENTVKAVSKMLGGVKIDGYYSINMQDIGKLNHAVGGVTVTIDSDFGDVDPTLKKGETVTLSDEQAYNFLRYRQGIDDGENTSRMKRHRQYMQAFMEKIKAKIQTDPSAGADVYEQMSEAAVTDMSGGLLTDLLADMQQAEDLGIFELEGTTKLGQHLDDGLEHMEFYLDKMAIVKIMQNLYNIQEKK